MKVSLCIDDEDVYTDSFDNDDWTDDFEDDEDEDCYENILW